MRGLLKDAPDPDLSALIREHAIFKTVLDTTPNHLFYQNVEGRFLYVAPAIAQLYKFSKEEMVGRTWRELGLTAEAWEPMDDARVKVLASRKEFRSEVMSPLTGRCYEYRVLPVLGESGSVEGVVTTMVDITERNRSEIELRESEERFRSTMDSMMEGCQIIDPDWRYLYLNDVAEQQSRRLREELLGHRFMDVWPGSEATDLFAEMRRCMEERVPADMENEFVYPDGSTGWFELRISPVPEGIFILSIDISERKRTEEALRSKTEELDRYFANSLDLMCIADTDGYFRRLNVEWERALGFSLEELVGTCFLDLVHPDDIEKTRDAMNQLSNQNPILNFVNRYRCKDGSYRWIEWSSIPKGKMIYAAARDITERRRMENLNRAHLQISEYSHNHTLDEVLQKTLDEAEVLTESKIGFLHFVSDDQETLQLQMWSTNTLHEMCTAEGKGQHYSISQAGVWVDCVHAREPVIHNDVAGLPHRKGVPPGHAPVIRELVVPVIRSGKVRTILGVGNKEIGYNQDDVETVRDLADLVWDITERKRMEEAIRRSEMILRGAVTNLPAVLWATNADGVFTLSEGRGLDGLGLKPGEVVGRSAFELYHNYPIIIEAMQKALSGLESSYMVDVGDTSFQSWIVPLRDERGAITGVLGVAADITARKKLEEDLRRSNEELELFAYIASHDLREPLRMITSYLDLLEKQYGGGTLDERAKLYMHYAVDGAERMRQLIDDLLIYSRVGTQGKTLDMVDMSDVLATVLKDLKKAIDESEASITSDPLPMIVADRIQMIQLLENLVGNAIKFRGEEAPRIRLSVRDNGNEWVFSVQDNGIGIDSKHREKIFQMFHRLHSRDEYEGTGIGLAISRKIVERHGGRIWFESEPGKGSIFYFTVPMVKRGLRAGTSKHA